MQEIQVKILQMEGGIWNKNSLFWYFMVVVLNFTRKKPECVVE